MNTELYKWQEDCLKRWFANNCRGMVQAVTGSGKTLLALAAAGRLAQKITPELRVKIVVPTETLMRQWNHAVKGFLSDKDKPSDNPFPKLVGLRGGGCKSPPDCTYMIYVVNSARYELARQILAELRSGMAVLLIADECHHYISGQNQLIFEFLPHIQPCADRFFSMGLSATLPSGQPGHELAAALGRKIYSYGIAEAAARRTVCQHDIYHIGLSLRSDEADEYQELSDRMSVLYRRLLLACPALGSADQQERYELLRSLCAGQNKKTAETAALYMRLSFKRTNLVCMASARLDCAYRLIQHLGIRDKILVFGERIRQAEALYQLLQAEYPGKAGRYHSKLGAQANKNALDRFRTGDIRILIACKAIDEGIDVPDAATGIILSGTSTRRQRVQRLGRILRQSEGKTKAALYYLHLSDTSEDVCYLPDVGTGSRITELEYLPDQGAFFNAPYEQAATRLLEQMEQKGLDKAQLQEAGRCLALGSVRNDWLADESLIETQIERAGSVRERNYWVCMKKMGK